MKHRDTSPIGTCPSCDRPECPTPKRRRDHPQEGCPQWTHTQAPKQLALWLCPPEPGVKTP